MVTVRDLVKRAIGRRAGTPSDDRVRFKLTLVLSREAAEHLTAEALRTGKHVSDLVAGILEAEARRARS